MDEEKSEIATIILEIPERLLQKFGETPGIRSKLALEALAIECYRTRRLTNTQCARISGMTPIKFEEMLIERGIPSNLPVEDVIRGYRALVSKK